MNHALTADYYAGLVEQTQIEGTHPRCNTFSSEYLLHDVCPTCEAYDAEHGTNDVDCSGSWL